MTLKRSLRSALERAAAVSGLVGLCERRQRDALTVLMYHRVLPDADCADYPFPSLVMPASAFGAQMQWLAAHARVLPLGAALDALPDAREDARALVAVTFDDGYADNRELAAPLAEAAGLRLTFFATTDFVGDGRALWFDRARALFDGADAPLRRELAGGQADVWIESLKHLEPAEREARLDALVARASPISTQDVRPMGPDDLRALARAGHEIASHGTGHSVLTALGDSELERELVESRARLAEWLGSAPDGLAYPNGDCDARVAQAARRAGYRWACTTTAGTCRAQTERLGIPRRDVTPRAVLDESGRFDALAFRCELAGLRDAWRRLRAA